MCNAPQQNRGAGGESEEGEDSSGSDVLPQPPADCANPGSLRAQTCSHNKLLPVLVFAPASPPQLLLTEIRVSHLSRFINMVMQIYEGQGQQDSGLQGHYE